MSDGYGERSRTFLARPADRLDRRDAAHLAALHERAAARIVLAVDAGVDGDVVGGRLLDRTEGP